MRTICKIIASIFIIAILIAHSQSTEAQFLKKLGNALEKVNEVLEETNQVLSGESHTNSNTQPTTEMTNSTDMAMHSVGGETVIDDSDWETPEQIVNTPYITYGTRFTQIDNLYNPISPVHDGAFALKEGQYYSFWKITGEKLFDAEWEYCNELHSTERFPLFNSGVASARRIIPNSTGHKVICLLYLDGSIKELDPSWEEITSFCDGLAIVEQKTNSGRKKYFYINVRGEKVYPNLTLYGDKKGAIRPIKDGLRAYPADYYKWGYIDATGNVVLPAIYTIADNFSEGYAWVQLEKGTGLLLIDKTGATIFKTENTKLDYVSKVNNGIFYVIHDNMYNYYDLKGNLLASYSYATPFCDGYAYVSKNGIFKEGVTMINTNFERHKSFKSGDLEITSLSYQPRFEPLGLATVKNMNSNHYVMTPDGEEILRYYSKSYSDRIIGLDQFTESGYARIKEIIKDGNKYVGFVKPTGEIVWLFGNISAGEVFTKPWPSPQPIKDPKDTLRDTVIIPIYIETPPTGPRTIEKTYYTVTVSASGGGTASISPSGKFLYGDYATLKVVAQKDWAVADISVESDNMSSVDATKPFAVTSNMHITVKFIKKDDDLPPTNTGCYQGSKLLKMDKYITEDITYYVQLNSSQEDTNPYGNNTYGFIVAMIDPTHRYITPELSTYMFCPPFRISGYQHEQDTGRDWLLIDGGPISYGGIKVNPENKDGLGALWLQALITLNGLDYPKLKSRHYRVEMLNINSETGEFECGKMETFSPKYGWLPAGSKLLVERTKGFFSVKTDYGMPADFFQGVKFKTSPKRDDVYWYPPLLWYGDNQADLDKVIEEMKIMYRTFETDYDKLFNE